MNFDQNKAKELSYMSKLIGQNEMYVQACGGNTSVKLDDTYMLIKASGVHLTDVTENSGHSAVNYSYIAEQLALRNTDAADEQKILEASLKEGLRPSIETFLHSLTQKYTIHTHPVGVLIYAGSDKGMERLKELFPSSISVPYVKPGIQLAQAFFKEMKSNSEARIIFLANHGLIVSGDTMEETVALHEEVMEKIDRSLGIDRQASETGADIFRALQEIRPGAIAYRAETEAVRKAMLKAEGAWSYSYSPDCIVYCGNAIAVLKNDYAEELRSFCETNGDPRAVIANSCCFAVADNVRKARDIVSLLDYSAKVYLSGEELTELDQAEKDLLLNWDSEKYRVAMK